MSSSYAMFQASSVYFQYENEQAAHVKIDLASRSVVHCPLCVANIYLVDTVEATFLAQSTLDYVRMFVLIKSRTSLNLCDLGQKQGHQVKLKKYLVGAVEATFLFS